MADIVKTIIDAFVAALIGAVLLYVLGVVILSLATTQPWYAKYAWPIVGAFAGVVIIIIKKKA
jgi:biotin transporter BioY